MDRQAFFAALSNKLYELGVSEDYVDKYVRQFERYFNTMTDEEANEQINGFDSVDGIAKNIVGMIKKRETKEEAERRLSERAKLSDASIITYDAIANRNDESASGDTRVIDRIDADDRTDAADKTDESEAESDDLYDVADDSNSSDNSDDSDVKIAGRTQMISLTDFDVEPAESDEPVESDKSDESVEDEDLYGVGDIDDEPKSAENTRNFNVTGRAENMPRTSGQQRHFGNTEYEETPAVNFNELDDRYDEENIPNTVLYWMIVILTTPLTLPLLFGVVAAFGAVFAGMAVSILALIIGLIGIIIAGTGISLVGIIYGATQVFEAVPAGLFEIGLGVIVGGVAMLFGILIYNFAVRFLPFVMRYLGVFFGFTMRKIKDLYRLIKRECAKQK